MAEWKKKRLTERNLEHSCSRSQGFLSRKEKRRLIRIPLQMQTAWHTIILSFFNPPVIHSTLSGQATPLCVCYRKPLYLKNMFHSRFHSLCTRLYQDPPPALKNRDTTMEATLLCFNSNTVSGFRCTFVTQWWLADAILEFIVLTTFGTYVTICTEFTIGYAGQAGVMTPVRIEPPGTVDTTATLVEETLQSIFICEAEEAKGGLSSGFSWIYLYYINKPVNT